MWQTNMHGTMANDWCNFADPLLPNKSQVMIHYHRADSTSPLS